MALIESCRSIDYQKAGVDYDPLDLLKKVAQKRGRDTAENLKKFGMQEISASRGESAYVWEEDDRYNAFVLEGLGTKNRIADEMRKITGKTYYDGLAKDTVAMIVNDLITVGAKPQVINAYFAVGDSTWFSDQKRTTDLVNGWANACNECGAVWGGGETPTLKKIIEPDTIDLSGSAIGIIKPKNRLILGQKIVSGDTILLVESSGIHANGLTLARAISEIIPNGFAEKLPNGSFYGESLLVPTLIYANIVNDLFEREIDIHYMVNITGHGWRKLMRSSNEFSYVIDKIPTPYPIFNFIKEKANLDDYEMYQTFNMGVGFALFLPEYDCDKAIEIIKKNNIKSLKAGYVESGEKQVIISPLNITFPGSSLSLR